MEELKIKRVIEEVFYENGLELMKIILFGSRARGDYKKKSDWDLLVIVGGNLSRKEKQTIAHIIRKKLAEYFIPCDVLIKTPEEVKERKDVVGSIIRTALKYGVTL